MIENCQLAAWLLINSNICIKNFMNISGAISMDFWHLIFVFSSSFDFLKSKVRRYLAFLLKNFITASMQSDDCQRSSNRSHSAALTLCNSSRSNWRLNSLLCTNDWNKDVNFLIAESIKCLRLSLTFCGSSDHSFNFGHTSLWKLASGKTEVTKPNLHASVAVIVLLKKSISLAFKDPMSLGKICEEQASGDWPNALKGVWNHP